MSRHSTALCWWGVALAALLMVQGLGVAHRYWHGLTPAVQSMVHASGAPEAEVAWPQHEKGLLCSLVDHLAAGDAWVPQTALHALHALDHAWIPSLGEALAFGPAPVAQARGPPLGA